MLKDKANYDIQPASACINVLYFNLSLTFDLLIIDKKKFYYVTNDETIN